VTTLTHGAEAAAEAVAASRALFGNNTVSVDDASVPTATIAAGDIATGEITIAEAFVRSGLCSSRGEARRLAQQGGLSIDDVKIDDVDQPFMQSEGAALFRVGKKRYMRVVVE
jgi:tyrosyl-tRNA synthetase